MISQDDLNQPCLTLTAAAGAFAELLVKEADNNVKLIVLDRIDVLREKFPHVLDGLVMDVLKVLSRCVTLVPKRIIRMKTHAQSCSSAARTWKSSERVSVLRSR